MKQQSLINQALSNTENQVDRSADTGERNIVKFPSSSIQTKITEEYISQLCHQATSKNTHRAYSQDKRYFWAWAHLAEYLDEHYPVSIQLIQKFLISHTLEMDKKTDAQLLASGIKKKPGPYKITTLNRILATISREHQIRNLNNPVIEPQVKLLKRQLKKLQPDLYPNKKKAITLDILNEMLKTCDKTSVIGIRDAALLTVGFATGGRRRSELAAFKYEDLTETSEGFLLKMTKSKNDQLAAGYSLPVFGKAAITLRRWIKVSGVNSGFLFRSVSKSGEIGKSLNERSIDQIVKKRIKFASHNPGDYSAHSLRSGFMTETGRQQGVSLAHAMQMSTHKSKSVALSYFNEGSLLNNPAARLFE